MGQCCLNLILASGRSFRAMVPGLEYLEELDRLFALLPEMLSMFSQRMSEKTGLGWVINCPTYIAEGTNSGNILQYSISRIQINPGIIYRNFLSNEQKTCYHDYNTNTFTPSQSTFYISIKLDTVSPALHFTHMYGTCTELTFNMEYFKENSNNFVLVFLWHRKLC